LLFSLQIFDTGLLASLLVLFLDPNDCKEYDETSEPDIDIKEVGSPLRLQQLLSLFFPAFCLKSNECRNKLLGSIENALVLAMEDIPKKKANRSKVFQLVSIADYVCSVVSGNGVMSNEVITGGDGTDTDEQKLDLSLSACLQVAKFLVENVQKLNLTQTRSMCKFLGNQDIKLENEQMIRLGKLKDLIEELSFLEESSCSKALRPLVDLLSNVKGYEDNYNDTEEGDKEEPGFDTTYDDDDTISENITEMTASDTIDETTIEDIDMMSTIACLSLENKENPPAIVKTRRKSQRSSSQSNISVLGSLGSPNL
jgi:condensin complex subunit 3